MLNRGGRNSRFDCIYFSRNKVVTVEFWYIFITRKVNPTKGFSDLVFIPQMQESLGSCMTFPDFLFSSWGSCFSNSLAVKNLIVW